jgi:hypothetical protein
MHVSNKPARVKIGGSRLIFGNRSDLSAGIVPLSNKLKMLLTTASSLVGFVWKTCLYQNGAFTMCYLQLGWSGSDSLKSQHAAVHADKINKSTGVE